MGAGTLYVVATPLGNLEDITFRAVRVLKEAPVIACEDTRRTVKLLNRYEIRTPMVVFHDYNKARAGAGSCGACGKGRAWRSSPTRALPPSRIRGTTWCGTPSRRGFPWR